MAVNRRSNVYYTYGLTYIFLLSIKTKWVGFKKNFLAGLWIVGYLLFMICISYIGSEKFGGLNIITYGWDMVLISIVSFLFYRWAINSGFKTKDLQVAQKINGRIS